LKFPTKIKGIQIGQKCSKLCLLHGASSVETNGVKIASLVLHYKDGSTADIEIVSGEHVQDWWGPIYTTDAGDYRNVTAPGTELAWIGGNPSIKKNNPEFSLRLYKSAFENPRPEVEIATIDYVSTITDAAPFLAGLTLE
jgi:hypothetical protein